MAMPTYKASGTFTPGTGSITPPYPTGGNAPAANDIALLVIESENEAISVTTPNGFALLGSATSKAAGTAATDPASRLVVYWKRCVGSDSAPVVADSGNHTTAQIHLFTGCITSGNPWDTFGEGNGGNSTSISIPGITTATNNCLIVLISTSSFNGTSTAQFSNWTNTGLTSLTERTDNTDTAGLGGGHGMATGGRAGAGWVPPTTVTLANTSFAGTMSIALRPPSNNPSVSLNSPSDTASISDNTPDLLFTGTDGDGDTLEYNVQVHTANTFNAPRKAIWLQIDSVPVLASDLNNIENPGQSLIASVVSNYLSLSFGMGVLANAYHYEDMTSVSDYTVQSGDYLEYDVYWDTSNALIGVDLICSDGSALRDSGAVDQNSISAHPNATGVGTHANGAWYHRRIALPAGWVGKTISKYDLVCEYNSGGTITGRVRDVAITSGSGVSGPLINTFSSTDTGFTAGHPFSSGTQITYTVQSALSSGTYYWRVRAVDPTGTNNYGSWATTRSFTLTVAVNTTNFFQFFP
jgi:hypothetical protein